MAVQLRVRLVVRGHPALKAVELREDGRHLRGRFLRAALRAAALSAATALTFAATSTTASAATTTPTAPFRRGSNQVRCQLLPGAAAQNAAHRRTLSYRLGSEPGERAVEGPRSRVELAKPELAHAAS